MELSAVLFDRDGTVIVDRHYLGRAEGVELIPGAGQALGLLRQGGLAAYLVSNQSGIGRGYFPESGWHECHARLQELLEPFGAGFDDARFCPHAPEEACGCRKPAPGMWESLKAAHGLSAACCAMVGDKAEDLLFGVNARLAAAVLVLTGKGEAAAQKLGLDGERIERQGFTAVELPEMNAGATRLFAARDILAAVRGLLEA
ncbi:HAD-IIIA family hydrolase [Mailhella massiliensis]|uniref:D,D-heptose 1,7-bisphosphate phosphatase n=1 Tax=Mailhella massiliensis TaxID=1903261 RepID=A0A921AV70_9BACT|nr:HAD-IIIA family hydrolase [Mailhella massiliensis]HJD96412.1 HAD-IIIA family hydrolase [Mailhella massiliensis]